ncbi:MAG: hypothetical protein CME06_05615 [Gemmatimonadetes bacterium]|nr:hypothetical protein [Gemmatimonadota bacterium]
MQPLLLLGGLAILSVGTLGVNYLLVDTRQDLQDSRIALPAINSTHSLVGWAASMRFDEEGSWLPLQQLTDWDALGPDSGEGEDEFDDVDDLHGLTRAFVTEGVTVTANCSVEYVEEGALTLPVQTRTHHKLLTVTVTGEFLPDPVIYQSVFSSGT